MKLKNTSLDGMVARIQSQLEALQREKGGSTEMLNALNKQNEE